MSKQREFLFRFRSSVAGGHTHVRLFAGKGVASLGLCGTLVFRNEEWIEFVDEVNRGKAGTNIEFLKDGIQAV